VDSRERQRLDDLEGRRRKLPVTRLGAGYGVSEVDAVMHKVFAAIRSLLSENEGLRSGVAPGNLWFGNRARPTPLDVQAVVFPLVRFGRAYKMRAVDELLDDVTDVLTRLSAENELLRRGQQAR
jgi:DivIVA domain-containing protein